MAIVNDTIVKEGDVINGTKVIHIDITQSCIEFRYNGSTFIKKLGEGVNTKEVMVREDADKNIGFSGGNKVERHISDGDKLYKEAIENYDSAISEDNKADMSKAIIYYEKSIKYAQWAYLAVSRIQRSKLNEIIDKSRTRLGSLQREKEKIASLKYAELNTPIEISEWLKKKISYRSDPWAHYEADYWQTPEETITLRNGDCEDYAFLSQALLNEIGINSSVIAIEYKKRNEIEAHAICVFPKHGPYNCFDGRYLRMLNKWSIEEIADELYPNWIRIWELNLFQHSFAIISEKS